jgi:hypothetical protein
MTFILISLSCVNTIVGLALSYLRKACDFIP